MKKLLAILAIATIAGEVFAATNVILPGYSGNIVFSTTLGRAHGGDPSRYATGVANGPVADGFDNVEETISGGPSSLFGAGGDKGDFFAVFRIDDILGSGGSKMDIPAGKEIAGIFFGLKDLEATDPAPPGGEVFVESTGGRVEFYLINAIGGASIAAPGLSGASWDGAGKLTYVGINDAGQEALLAFDLKAGELSAGDEPGFGSAGGIFNAVTTEIRSLNTTPGGAAGNNGAFYAKVDKTFGNTVLANRLANGGFGLTGGADLEGDYTMNVNTLESPFGANNFSLEFNDPLRTTITAIPEPSTILLLGTGLMGLVAYRRRNAA